MFTVKTRRWVIFMFILVTDLLLLFLSSWPSFQDLIDSVITLSSILSAIWEWPEIVRLLLSRRWLFQKHKLPNILLRIHILNPYNCFWNCFSIFRSGCFQDQDSLLVKRRNDNHSPGPVIRELVPSSHQRSELSNTILCIFSGWDQRIGEGIPIPDSLGEEATFINICEQDSCVFCGSV